MMTELQIEEKRVSREIHRLFWRASWQAKYLFVSAVILRIPSLIFLHVSIPVAIAYGLQATINRDFGAVSGYAWQIILFAFLYAVTWTLAGLAISKNGVVAGKYLQKQVFGNYLQKDHEFYSNAYFGSLGAQATRLREAMNNEYNLITTLLLPKQMIIVGGGLVVIGSHSLTLALITGLAMVVILSWTFVTSKWRLRYRRELGTASSELSGQIGDALTQATVTKSFANESYEGHRLDRPLAKWAKAQYTSWALAGPTDAVRMLLTGTATALLLVVTARLYEQGGIDLALVALVQLYVVKIFAATVDITDMLKTYESAMGAAYQPIKTMLYATSVNDPASPQKLAAEMQDVSLRDVSFTYHVGAKGPRAVKNLSLEVKAGEKLGIVGYSGSGKTTLTKLLVRFMDVTDGSLQIGGIDIRNVRQHDLRKHIAYVPQEPLLFHRSIKENIAYGDPGASEHAIVQAARLAYVDEFVDDLPEKYDTMVGERGVKLSGGQRQRVAIARAILKDAPILVLDEATSALDSRSEQLIQKALWDLMKDRTAIVIAHRLSTIQRMDKIAVMDKGSIVEYGSHEELLEKKGGIYAALWSHQSGGYLVDSA